MHTHKIFRMYAAFAMIAAFATFITGAARAQESCSNGSPPPCTGGGDDSGVGVGDQIGLTQPPVNLPLPGTVPPSLNAAPPIEEEADEVVAKAILAFVSNFYVPPPEGSTRVEIPELNLESDPDVQEVAGDLGSLSIAM